MTYTVGSDIDDADYDVLAAAIRAEWGVGDLDHGIGQSEANMAQVDELQDTTAAQWNAIVQATNKLRIHQGLVSMPVTEILSGDLITPIPLFDSFIADTSTRMGECNLSPSTSVPPTTIVNTAPWGSKDLRNLEMTFEVTFNSADAARYFFNAGGKIRLDFDFDQDTNTPLNLSWNDLLSKASHLLIGWKNSTASSFPATTILNANNGGYWSGTPGYKTHYLMYAPSPYQDNYIKVEMLWTGILGSHGGYPKLVIKVTFMNASGSPGLYAVEGQMIVNLSMLEPNLTNISKSWGTPSVSGNVTAKSSGDASFVYNLNITSNTTNVNLRSLLTSHGWDTEDPVIVSITNSAVVGSTATTAYSMDIGGPYPTGSVISLINNGTIVGKGGAGGNGGAYQSGSDVGLPGGTGGSALRVAHPGTIITNNGTIAGGGGGGGGGAAKTDIDLSNGADPNGGGGGGGAGYTGGAAGRTYDLAADGGGGNAGSHGTAGSLTVGGAGGTGQWNYYYYGGGGGGYGIIYGGNGGQGGARGLYGTAGSQAYIPSWSVYGTPGAGGAPGKYIVGYNNVVWLAYGNLLGPVTY